MGDHDCPSDCGHPGDQLINSNWNVHPAWPINSRMSHDCREAAALAEYHMGCNMQFRDDADAAKEGGAAKRFDSAIARVGSDSVIGISAVLNRGCVYESEGEKDKAIRAFTTVIASHKASDETRACAFNNRANIYGNSGDHKNAIRDRTECWLSKQRLLIGDLWHCSGAASRTVH